MGENLEAFLKPLEELQTFVELKKHLKKNKGVLQLSGCMDSQKLHMIYGLGMETSCRVILTYSEMKAREICEEYAVFDPSVCYYPARDLLFSDVDIQGSQLGSQRMQVIRRILEGRAGTIVSTIDGCMDCLPPSSSLLQKVLTISMDGEYDIAKIRKTLQAMGYEREELTEGPGQFAVRGAILDIFPFTEELPVRIEFFGDEINFIRSFDAESQRSVEELDEVRIFPAEPAFEEEDRKSTRLNSSHLIVLT